MKQIISYLAAMLIAAQPIAVSANNGSNNEAECAFKLGFFANALGLPGNNICEPIAQSLGISKKFMWAANGFFPSFFNSVGLAVLFKKNIQATYHEWQQEYQHEMLKDQPKNYWPKKATIKKGTCYLLGAFLGTCTRYGFFALCSNLYEMIISFQINE
jgi:hypothetical protein